jgi:aryl-alcohol dehydrogenase-like predicted oxidoreductase
MDDVSIERGGNFIDTANIYTSGHSEQIIGSHIGCNPAKRDRIVIATKFSGNSIAATPMGAVPTAKASFPIVNWRPRILPPSTWSRSPY